MPGKALDRFIAPQVRRPVRVGAPDAVEAIVEGIVVALDVLGLRTKRFAEDDLDPEPKS